MKKFGHTEFGHTEFGHTSGQKVRRSTDIDRPIPLPLLPLAVALKTHYLINGEFDKKMCIEHV